MTELATVDQQNGAVERAPEQPQPAAMSELMRWANDARQASAVARSLATTSFVPASLRVEPKILPRMTDEEQDEARGIALDATVNNITGAILTGNELGLKPMAALRSIDIITGTPAMRAHAMRGLVQSHGHEVELVESTTEVCRMRGRRRGAQAWQPVEWDLDRARGLELLGKKEWKKQPKTMLVARATGELCRLIASDVLHGVPYAAEELYDSTPAPVQVVASRPVTADEILGNRPGRPAVAPAAEPDRPAELTEPAPPVGRDPKPRMFAVLGELKVTDRDERLAVCSELLHRPIGSTKDMDPADVEAVTEALAPLVGLPEEDRAAEVAGLISDGTKLRAGVAR